MSVSFKTYLVGGSDGNVDDYSSEIRRFFVASDVASSFIYLEEKLAVIYPSLKQKQFIVQWKDEEGDMITISSDEELINALSSMKSDILRLYIKVKTTSAGGGLPKGGYKDEQHAMVSCDGCDKGITGFRYKCIECPDFDLCSSCESRKMHYEHKMIRIPKPIDRKDYAGFMPWLFGSIGRHNWGRHRFPFEHRHEHRRHRGCNNDKKSGDDSQEECGSQQQKPNEQKPAEQKPNEQKNEQGSENYPIQFQKVMENIWTVLGGLPKEQGEATASSQNGGNKNANGQFQFNPEDFMKTLGQTVSAVLDPLGTGAKQNGQNSSGTNGAGQNQYKPEEFLKNIGQTVAAVLDPLGIDVEVDVHHNGAQCSFGSRASSNKATSPTKETAKTPEKEEVVIPTTKVAEEPKKDEPVGVQTPPVSSRPDEKARSGSPTTVLDSETGDWTYIGEKEKAQIPASVTPTKVTEKVSLVFPKQASNGPIPMPYRSLNGNPVGGPPTSSLSDEMNLMSQEVQHPNPVIRDGLQQMLSMGFTNEGGWLTQLLEVKRGDIDSVLEVLAPVNNPKH